MSNVDSLPHCETGYFSNLICNYLDQKKELRELYQHFPNREGFEHQLQKKSDFSKNSRETLVEELRKQYQRLGNLKKDLEKVQRNISAIGNNKTFTITTGHQLNIFTGPLYFIYKIITTINLAQQLMSFFPDYYFIPVYWMATEDHDFDEINHINQYGGRLIWNKKAHGALGRLDTDGIKVVIDELAEHLGLGADATYLVDLFRRSYEQHSTLAEATLYLTHELFGDKGLVVVNADNPQFKRQAITLFKDDLLEHIAFNHFTRGSEILQKHYFEQVYVREINLFYLRENLRERIEKQADSWHVVNTELHWTREELLEELGGYPERFSPNVVLRSMYQELILPNLAYVGGGGELAYWLQLKQVFEANGILFPLLVLRNSAVIVNQKQADQLKKLGLELRYLFNPLHEIKKKYVQQHAPIDIRLHSFKNKLQAMFDELEEIAKLTERPMLGAVNAQRQKQLNGLEKLKKKLIRSEKRRHSEEMERIERLYYELFPNALLQERHDNFAIYYSQYGQNFIEELFRCFKSLDFCFNILKIDRP